MSTILIGYYSRTGNTQAMAQEIGRGAQEAGATVDVKPVEQIPVDSLPEYRAIVLGSPDYYGSMAAPVKKLLDDSVKFHGQLAGKVGGAFSSSANIGGGNETTVLSIVQALLVHGMVVPGIAIGDHYGPVSINAPDERALRQCRKFGQMIAKLTAALAHMAK
jgi:NAD(P)H dehydrogenase (quinone)